MTPPASHCFVMEPSRNSHTHGGFSKANHRLGVVGRDCGKQTAMGFVGGCFCCLSALSARAQWGGYTEDFCYLEGQSDA